MRRRRRLEDEQEVRLLGVVRRDQRRERAQECEEREDDDAGDGQAVLEEPLERHAPLAALAVRGGGKRDGLCEKLRRAKRGHYAYLIRGSR